MDISQTTFAQAGRYQVSIALAVIYSPRRAVSSLLICWQNIVITKAALAGIRIFFRVEMMTPSFCAIARAGIARSVGGSS